MSSIPQLMGGRKLSHSLDFDGASAASALLRLGVQALDMAGATTTLVTKQTSTSGEVQLKGQILTVDANATGGGSSGQTLKLPPEADSKGLFLIIYNIAEQVVIQDDAGAITLATLAASGGSTGEWALCWCDGEATTTDSKGTGDVGWKAHVFSHTIT